MQYVHRKLQRSVTEMRRSLPTLPNVSMSGPVVGVEVEVEVVCTMSLQRTRGNGERAIGRSHREMRG
jgi:hypothetical protein